MAPNARPVTKMMADAALAYVDELIQGMLNSSVTKRSDLFIVVGIRRATPGEFTHTVLATKSYGNRSQWENRYDTIAQGKWDISARTGLPTREVQLLHPEMLIDGDVKYWGSAVVGDIVVACSGVQPYFDEALSYTIAWILHSLNENSLEHQREDAKNLHYSFPGQRPQDQPAPYCMQCGIQMQRAGSVHACPSCGATTPED